MKKKSIIAWLSLVFAALLSHSVAAAEVAVGVVLATAGTVNIQRNGQPLPLNAKQN